MSSFIDSVIDAVESLLAWIGTVSGATLEKYCHLEIPDDSYTLVGKDGSLMSVVRVDGATQLIGQEEKARIYGQVELSLRSYLSGGGHAIQVLFIRDPDLTQKTIADTLAPARATAKRLHLDIEDVLDEKIQYLSRFCGYEQVYFVLWTRPAALSRAVRARSRRETARAIKQAKVPPVREGYGQNPFIAVAELRELHATYIEAFIQDLEQVGLALERMDVHAALHDIRAATIDPEWTSPHWRPVLPGDQFPERFNPRTGEVDLPHALWPPLWQQLFPRDALNLDERTVRIGDRLYAPLFMDLPPQDPQEFQRLFDRVATLRIPWRISFFLDSDGLKAVSLKALLASILSFTASGNQLIAQAVDALREREQQEETVIKLQVCLATWIAGNGSLYDLRTRASHVARALEGWGSCESREITGDPLVGTLSSALGIMAGSIGTVAAAPLTDAVPMLPLLRPASPWREGALLFRSLDGKLLPYQPGSSQQSTWIDLVFARPGSGKSVLLNASNFALALAPGLQRLPRIAIIDVGPSSSGFISLLREALPEKYKHLAAYHRLRMTAQFAVNPFDTQLGNRKPTPQERAFLVNFLTLLATPPGAEHTYDGIADMIGLIIDEVYKLLADEQQPRRYSSQVDAGVDRALADIRFTSDSHTTWWEVVDALFAAGYAHEAGLAQRYAVPTVADTVVASRHQAIEDIFGRTLIPTGEPLVDAYIRMMSSAVREYPILAQPTRFDLGEARIVSLDLEEVAGRAGGIVADRQTAIVYMLARHVLARDYYLTAEHVGDMHPRYQAYHRRRTEEIREDPKRLCYDEFHRTARAAAVRDQVVLDMREGRKWGVQIALLSQSLDDFSPAMVEFATSIFIMDAGPQQAIDRAREVFGLSPTAVHALSHSVHGPSKAGATFLAVYSTKRGTHTLLLTNTLGPIELWAFSTTEADVVIRNRLYAILGPREARRRLAAAYPGGTAKDDVERRQQAMRHAGRLDEDMTSVYDQIVKEVLTVGEAKAA